MFYYLRYVNSTYKKEITYEEAREVLREYCCLSKKEADMSMLDVPNTIDIVAGELICVGPQGEQPLYRYRNLSAAKYYSIINANNSDAWVDPWKILLGGLAQMAKDAEEREERGSLQKAV